MVFSPGACRRWYVTLLRSHGFHRVAGIDPRTRATDDVEQGPESPPGEEPRGGARTITAGADHGRRGFWASPRGALCQAPQRYVDGPWDVATGVLTRLAHIDHLHVLAFFQLVPQLVHGYLGDGRYGQTGLMPGVHATVEIALHVLDAHP